MALPIDVATVGRCLIEDVVSRLNETGRLKLAIRLNGRLT